ncbi:hypothetical protein [Escherichia coli]|uniref:hypothetical protein n=1 Tax=Escherichia coli TaxID=562 RepID=UPI00112F45EC|nr:hypothetical protein [Escherichia coli]
MMCKTRFGASVLLSICLCGCQSYQAVDIKRNHLENSDFYIMKPQLYSGDEVKYKLNSGEEGYLTISGITPAHINGTDNKSVAKSIPTGQILSLEKKELSKTKTGVAVAGGVAIATVIVAAVVSLAVISACGAALSAAG